MEVKRVTEPVSHRRLVLSREFDQRIVIKTKDELIVVTHAGIVRGRVRFLVSASSAVTVDREEVFVQRQKRGL